MKLPVWGCGEVSPVGRMEIALGGHVPQKIKRRVW